MPRIEFIVATTPSRVAFQSVRRLLVLLKDLGVPIIGVVENIVMKPNAYIKEEVSKLGLEPSATPKLCGRHISTRSWKRSPGASSYPSPLSAWR